MYFNVWVHDVEKQIDYKFKNPDLLQQAFVRKTYAIENGGGDNEILEFIGDRALEFAVTRYLMNKHGYLAEETEGYKEFEDWNEYFSELSEGELTELKKRLVQGKTLAKRTEIWGWDKHLFLGEGDKKNNIAKNDSVKEDLFEAIIGAVAIDSKWNLEAIQNVVELALDPDSELEEDESLNYVSLVQDWYVSYYRKNPVFECSPNTESNNGSISKTHYGKTKRYRCEFTLNNLNNKQKKFVGYGDSKCEARRNLCERIYKVLDEQGLINTIREEIKNPNKDEAINQLETLSRRGYFSLPSYSYKEGYDQDGNPVWSARCQIEEYTVFKNAKASSKKEAKKKAAFKMLNYVLKGEE